MRIQILWQNRNRKLLAWLSGAKMDTNPEKRGRKSPDTLPLGFCFGALQTFLLLSEPSSYCNALGL